MPAQCQTCFRVKNTKLNSKYVGYFINAGKKFTNVPFQIINVNYCFYKLNINKKVNDTEGNRLVNCLFIRILEMLK